MNIKSLLLGSAAALAAVSGAHAADAIVAAEPEPMEYVRVCDAFGTGYFYIPGTETCLKIGGYVRFQTNFGRDVDGTSDWDSFTRAQLDLVTKNDTEFGTLEGGISLRGNADSNVNNNEFVDAAYIAIAGFKVGYFYNWWDNDLSGETDTLGNYTKFNSIAYTYDGGAFTAGVSVDELDDTPSALYGSKDNGIGVSAQVTASLGGVNLYLLGGYDTEREEGAVRAIIDAEIGPGTLSVAGVYSSDPNVYFEASEWTVVAQYELKATDKLTITPAAQYFSDFGFVNGNDAWTAGVTVGYKITDGLRSLATVNYFDADNQKDQVTGFLRLQRDF